LGANVLIDWPVSAAFKVTEVWWPFYFWWPLYDTFAADCVCKKI